MSRMVRWCRFNAVGAMGVVVQLATLALIGRSGHTLVATAIAVELALIHNFVWHLHCTWRDRRGASSLAAQLLRFHLANGLVSMLGNLALMQLLVRSTHLPVLAANAIAILVCSCVNFLLGDDWVFPAGSPAEPATGLPRVPACAAPLERPIGK